MNTFKTPVARHGYLKRIPLNYVYLFAFIASCNFVAAATANGIYANRFAVLTIDKIVKGTVTDATGQPLPGVSVIIKGTSTSVVTDIDGNYVINLPAGANILVFSYIGMKTQEVAVGNQETVNVTLQDNVAQLEEVVLVGYGSSRKQDLTGSVAKIDSKDFQKGFVTNAEQLIANKIPGVQVTPTSGKPGAGSSMTIRGGASLNASNDPLIVIDGVPVGPTYDGPGILSSLNPDDIESFSVLKDASAAAIYGSRGSNGVILITTKKGSKNNTTFSFSNKMSISTVAQKESVLSANEFRNAAQRAATLSGTPFENILLGDANTDWQDEIYQIAAGNEINFSASGAVKNTPYRFSLGYLNQDGVLKTDNYKRYNTALNFNPTFFDNSLRINVSLKGSFQKEQLADQGAIGQAVSRNPTLPVYSPTSNFGGYWEYEEFAANPANVRSFNPVGILEQYDSRRESYRGIGNIQIDYNFPFLPELKANLNTGFDVRRANSSYYAPPTAFQYSLSNGSAYKADPLSKTENVFLEAYLNYVKDIKSIDSRIDVMGGYSYNDFLTTNYFYPTYDTDGNMQPNSTPTYPNDKPQNTLISVFGRVNYIFKEKYIVTGTIRQDGSSRFSEDNRWGTFPSAAVSWRINKENFLTNSKTVSNLKLRAGYGITGQQEGIGNYGYIPVYTLGTAEQQYQLGNNYYYGTYPAATDRNRKWEQTATTNAGIDWGLFNDRVSGNVDVYYKKTTDLLNTVNVPLGTDFTQSITKNIGSLENKGIEVGLNVQPIKNDIMSWDIGVNYSYNKNKILSLSEDGDDGVGLFSGSRIVNSVGYSRNTFYLYHQVYGADGKPLEETMLDVNNDGIINSDDRYRSKSSVPKHIIGFTTTFNYKKWSLNTALHSNIGHYMYYRPADNLESVYGFLVPTNVNTSVNQTGFYHLGNQLQPYSDYYLQNASFLKMDNVSLSYNAGNVFKSFNRDASLNFSVSVQNVFTITNYDGINPEAFFNYGEDFGSSYPIPRIYSIALNLNF